MNQSSRDNTLLGIRPSPSPGKGAVSSQSSRDTRPKRSLPGSTVRKEGSAISTPYTTTAETCPHCGSSSRVTATASSSPRVLAWSCSQCDTTWATSVVNPPALPRPPFNGAGNRRRPVGTPTDHRTCRGGTPAQRRPTLPPTIHARQDSEYRPLPPPWTPAGCRLRTSPNAPGSPPVPTPQNPGWRWSSCPRFPLRSPGDRPTPKNR